jgi:hypothetical protein
VQMEAVCKKPVVESGWINNFSTLVLYILRVYLELEVLIAVTFQFCFRICYQEYRTIQAERSVFWEVIVSAIVRKKKLIFTRV